MNLRGLAIPIVWIGVVILASIGIFVVLHRGTEIATSLATGEHPAPGSFAAPYVREPWLAYAHIGPGLLFVLLGPLQFVPRLRARHIALHRACGRILVACGVLVGTSAIALSLRFGYGGAIETAATLVFAPLFLVFLAKAVFHVRRREIAAHREWMLRAFSIGLAVATIRPVVGLIQGLAGLEFRETLGIAFWVSFTLHLVGAEVWIHAMRPRTSRSRPELARTEPARPAS
jgi:uncharacterized membrane protein